MPQTKTCPGTQPLAHWQCDAFLTDGLYLPKTPGSFLPKQILSPKRTIWHTCLWVWPLGPFSRECWTAVRGHPLQCGSQHCQIQTPNTDDIPIEPHRLSDALLKGDKVVSQKACMGPSFLLACALGGLKIGVFKSCFAASKWRMSALVIILTTMHW